MIVIFNQLLLFIRRHETKWRFVFAGGLNTLFGLLIFPVLLYLSGRWEIHYLIILIISNIISIHFAYGTNKLLVFRTIGFSWREYRRFISFYISYFVINLIVLPILVNGLDLSPIIAQYTFVICAMIASYFWHSRFTFNFDGPRS